MRRTIERLLAPSLLTFLLTGIIAAAEKEVVLMEDKFTPGAGKEDSWKGMDRWKIIDDKGNGATDAGSVVPNTFGQIEISTKEFDPVNPSQEHCIVRASARIRIASKKEAGTRFELRLLNPERQFYIGTVMRTAVLINLCEADGGNRLEKTPRWVNTRIPSDQKYHVYTLEIRPDGKVAIMADGDLLDERNLPDSDFAISSFHVVFIDHKESFTPGEWLIDEVKLSKIPVK